MITKFITAPEYTVYETTKTTSNPLEGLKLIGHPVAHYTDYSEMIDHWMIELLDGSHNFFVTEKE